MRSPSTTPSPSRRLYWEDDFERLRPELEKSLRNHATSSTCPLRDLGDFVLQEFELLVQFLNVVTEQAIQENQDRIRNYFRYSDDISGLAYTEKRENALRYVNKDAVCTHAEP
jgi:hypothetical protein